MNTSPVIPSHPNDPDMTEIPAFALSLWDNAGTGEVDVIVHVPTFPSETEKASDALLHGLGILILDHQGEISKVVEKTFPDGPPSEKLACDFINLMIQDDANALPV